MAIWQYNFLVVPNNSFEADTIQNLIDEDGFFDDELLWLKSRCQSNEFDNIGKILQKGKSWTDIITLYGEQDSNRFEVYVNEDNLVFSVSFRIDIRTQYEEILRSLIEFFISNSLTVLDEDLNKIALNYLSFQSIIENSPQGEKYKILSNGNKI